MWSLTHVYIMLKCVLNRAHSKFTRISWCSSFLNKCAGVSNRFFQHTLLSKFPVSSSWGSSIMVLFSKLGFWVDGLHVQLASQLPSRLLCRALQNQNLCEQLRILWHTTDMSKRFMPMFASVLLIRGTRPAALLSSHSVTSLLQLKLKFQLEKKGKKREFSSSQHAVWTAHVHWYQQIWFFYICTFKMTSFGP